MSDYRVDTEAYNGPMGLLLYLIKRDEIDIYDISVARITEQYLKYLEMLRVIDPDVAGEFLVMAALLMELKSRMLLPRPIDEDGEPEDLADPRMELVRQLLTYKKFKDASFELRRAAELQAERWPNSPAKISTPEPSEVDIEDAQIWDLVGAFNKIMSSIGDGRATHDVIFDDTPVSLHAADIVDRLDRENGELPFEAIFRNRTRVEMIGLFLALLELIRQARIRVTQEGIFGQIRIVLLSTDPIEIGEEWQSAFKEAALGAAPDSPPQEEVAVQSPAAGSGESAGSGVGRSLGDASSEPEDRLSFPELDRINVEVDVDAILRGRPSNPSAADADPSTEDEQSL